MGLIIRVCDKNAVPFTTRQFTEYFNTSKKPECFVNFQKKYQKKVYNDFIIFFVPFFS